MPSATASKRRRAATRRRAPRGRQRGGNGPAIKVYYHVFCNKDTQPIVFSQCTNILFSGLYRKANSISVSLTGEQKYIDEMQALIEKFGPKFTFVKGPGDTSAERFTLTRLRKEAQPGDKILYIHSKGVTRPNLSTVVWWRIWMEYFLMVKAEECLRELDTHDVVGAGWFVVNFAGITHPHFSGNFWWARGDYIQKLSEKIGADYYDPEFWIGSIDGTRVKDMSPQQSLQLTNMYQDEIKPRNYIKDE